MTVVIAIVGSGRGRGKTTLVEFLTHRLSKSFLVWTIKHVSTSFDIKEKDTSRHLEAGAEGTIAVSPNELVILKPQTQATLEMAIDNVPSDVDLILVEGFRGSEYPKILVALSIEEAEEQLGKIRGIFAISGPIENIKAEKSVKDVPILSSDDLLNRLSRMIKEDQINRLPGIDCKKCGYPSCKALATAILRSEANLKDCKTLQISDLSLKLDDAQVYLSDFPKKIIKNTILAMVSSLKGGNLEKAKLITVQVVL